MEIRNLTYTFPRSKDPFFRDLNFTIADNEINFLVGRNGVGKTTLIDVILGLRQAKLKIDKTFSYVYINQTLPMLGSITVGEIANLVLGIEYGKYEIELGYLKDKIEEYSFSFLQKRWNKHYQELSGGERKLVQLVLFLQIKRDLVVLDEPTAFLDRENVNNVFHVINANKDRTYLIITHDVRDLLLVNDYHLLSMDNHKIDHEFNKKTFENVNRDNSFLHYFAEV